MSALDFEKEVEDTGKNDEDNSTVSSIPDNIMDNLDSNLEKAPGEPRASPNQNSTNENKVVELSSVEKITEPVASQPKFKLTKDDDQKKVGIEDIDETDFKLNWSDCEEDDTPLSDEALKKLDAELGIEAKINEIENTIIKSQNKDTALKTSAFDKTSTNIAPNDGDSVNSISKTLEKEEQNSDTVIPDSNITFDENHKTLVVLSADSGEILSNIQTSMMESVVTQKCAASGSNLGLVKTDNESTNTENINIENTLQTTESDSIEIQAASSIKADMVMINSDTVHADISSNEYTEVECLTNNPSPNTLDEKILDSVTPITDIVKVVNESNINNVEDQSKVNKTLPNTKQITETHKTNINEQGSHKIDNLGDTECLNDITKTLPNKIIEAEELQSGDQDMPFESNLDKENDVVVASKNISVIDPALEDFVSKDTSTNNKVALLLSSNDKKMEDGEDGDLKLNMEPQKEISDNINKSPPSNDTNDSIKINTEHKINRPDVMLDIPTQEFDIDDFYDVSEKQENQNIKNERSDLTTKTVTEIVNELSKDNLDSANEIAAGMTDSDTKLSLSAIVSVNESNSQPTIHLKAPTETNLTERPLSPINDELISKENDKLSCDNGKDDQVTAKSLASPKTSKVNDPQTLESKSEDEASTSKCGLPSVEVENSDDITKATVAPKSDNIEDTQEVADSLGLLAESSRVLEEEEPEPEDVDGEADDDDDFDADCEENSNPTEHHSEESNPAPSEVEIQEEAIDTDFNSEVEKIEEDCTDATFNALLGDDSVAAVEEEVVPTEETDIANDTSEDNTIPAAADIADKPSETCKPDQKPLATSILKNLLNKPKPISDANKPEILDDIVDLEESSDEDNHSNKLQNELDDVSNQVDDSIQEMTENRDKENKEKDKSKGIKIYNLDSDDDDLSDKKDVSFVGQPKENNLCINYNCTSDEGVPYYLADRMTIAYYGAARRRRRPVCLNCLQVVNARNEGLVSGIKDLRPLMSLRMSRPTHTLLEISDSDSEGEDDPVGEGGAKVLENELTDMFNDVWNKYNMDERLKETEAYLEKELEEMEIKSDEVDRLLRECQQATDMLRDDLYRSFERPRKELPSISIHDTPIAGYSCLEADEPVELQPVLPYSMRYPKRSASFAAEQTPAKKAALPQGNASEVGGKTEDDNDVSVVRLAAEAAPSELPPPGEPVKPPLRPGVQVYAMKNQYGAWLKGKVLEIMPKSNESLYTMCKVRFEHKIKNPCKVLSARSLAYTEPSGVRMTIGTRVIALFRNSENVSNKGGFYYSGVIAEVPNPVNSYRYLVFFDDGYAQYVKHQHTRLVYESKKLVWEEVHPFSRDFVCNYLMKYPERPMVRMHAGQSVTVERGGKWWVTNVEEVDAALVNIKFPDGRFEWIYRGSTRLQPLFIELQAARRGDRARLPRSTKGNVKTNVPYVEYTRSDDQPKPETNTEDQRPQRSVAKKSTTIAQQITSAVNDSVISRVVFYTPKNSVRPLKMVPHRCGPHCKRKDLLTLADLQTYNPLTKPLLSGWERQIVKHKSSSTIMYRAPCGRRLRNIEELHMYLRAIKSEMAVDLFDFHKDIHCLAEFVLSKTNVQKKDLSHGKENIPVPCVNYYDNSLPDFCSYNTERTPTTGVPLNLDPDFLCGCDCDDDCLDKTKCACWKMTLEGAKTIGFEGPNVGYHYRRLPEPLPSGIYECNSRCKCKSTCLNRVVQNPLQLKLQVFKTLKRGWGIRALNDVPKGSFICIYAGNLLTDATANLDGLNEGDEYLAELDYIEVVEAMKEGYEEDIPEADKILDKKESGKQKPESEQESESSESEEDTKNTAENEGDDDFKPASSSLRVTEFSKRLRKREKKTEDGSDKKAEPKQEEDKTAKNDEEECITISDDEELRVSLREPSRFAAEETMTNNTVTSKYRSIRSYFGKDEACYIMDAKVQGNIGRYLNHSCSPNVFVQNVFVDTHDPRFPWVSFFALQHIRAGTELTWNYNYDVGSVPGKVLYCYCGASNCRGRLL